MGKLFTLLEIVDSVSCPISNAVARARGARYDELVVKSLHLSSGRALVVVAHPDDETIWMGGTILAHPEIDWTILALTRGSDHDRAPRFRRAMKALGARGIILNADDEERFGLRASVAEMEGILIKKLPHARFDYVFTHAANGEYGHLKHRAAHLAIRRHFRGSKLYTFAYEIGKSGKYAVPAKKSDITIKLPKTIFNKKLNLIKSIYGFPSSSFEYKSCSAAEKFNLLCAQ